MTIRNIGVSGYFKYVSQDQACVSQKNWKLYESEKLFLKLWRAYSVKLVFSFVVMEVKIKISAKFRDSEHSCFEDTKRIMSPEKFRDFRDTGPQMLQQGGTVSW